MNQRRSEQYHANPELGKARAKAWREKNLERARQTDAEKYRRNKPQHLRYTQARRRKDPTIRVREYASERQRFPWKRALINAVHRSGKKNLAFDLDRAWCEARWTGNCELSGIPFVFGSQTHFSFSPSIDRIDSSKGYVQSNCRFILFALNSFKGVGSDEQMLEIARALVSRQNAAPASP